VRPAARAAGAGGSFARIYAFVRRIPRGRVTSYGGVARQVGLRGGARTVGWAMASLPNDRTAPWWRVVRSDGAIAPRPSADEQRRRLRLEGVRVSPPGVIDLARYGWPSFGDAERVRPASARPDRARATRGGTRTARGR
jgi:methylated-DNA-protein-cysteine methyltransferase-like protein